MKNRLRYVIYCFFLVCAFLIGLVIGILHIPWINFDAPIAADMQQATVVYDCNGKELCRFQKDKRTQVTLKDILPSLIDAFIAAEDHHFFSHAGISLRGMLRSTIKNIISGRIVQGASTITQQLVKLRYLEYDRTIWRKLKELVLALQIEQIKSKEQIFEEYINAIYFGRGIYGVAAAAERFWGCNATELTLAQVATLAAIAKSAQHYSPLNNQEKSIKRRNVILHSMYQLKFITENEMRAAKQESLALKHDNGRDRIRTYLCESIRVWAEQQYGHETLYNGGLHIHTTIDTHAQALAEQSFDTHIALLRTTMGNAIDGGLIALDVKSGAIRAMIGGYDFYVSQFNRALHAVRQCGSSFKPFLYAAALDVGCSMRDVEVDEPYTLALSSHKNWTPHNWNNKFHGAMTLLKALTASNNIIAIKTLEKIGYKKVIDLASSCGIHRNLLHYPSLALGIAEATVLENTAAFNIFANHGYFVKPYFIEMVKNNHGAKIYQHTEEKMRVLNPLVSQQMLHALTIAMKKKKKERKEKWFAAESIGKSGTTNNSMTTWFVGSTPTLTTAVYIGRDDHKSMGSEIYARTTAFPIWADFYCALSKPNSCDQFYYDPKLKERLINWNTGEYCSGEDSSDVVPILEQEHLC